MGLTGFFRFMTQIYFTLVLAARRGLKLWPLGVAALGVGCVGVDQQRLVSKPGMLFSESAVYAGEPRILSQMEPGVTYGGARAAGCTSCR